MTDDNAPSAPPRSPHPSGLQRLGMTLALLFFIWVTFAYAIPYVLGGRAEKAISGDLSQRPKNSIAQLQEALSHIEELQTRVATLEARVKTLEELATAPTTPASDQAAAMKMVPVPPPIDPVADDGRLAEMEEQLHAQQSTLEEMKALLAASNSKLAGLTAFGQMKEAMARGEPFRAAWNRVQALASTQETKDLLARLAPYADSGIATPSQLQTDFADAVTRALSTSSSRWSETVHSLIRIRKVGETQQGSDDEAVLARAEAKLEKGDVALALKELAALSPPAADVFAAWKKQAEAYLEAREITNALGVTLLAPASSPRMDNVDAP